MDKAVRKSLMEEISNFEKSDDNRDASLFYIAATAEGFGTIKRNTYCYMYFAETRAKTLHIAELAYLFGVDFEWIS